MATAPSGDSPVASPEAPMIRVTIMNMRDGLFTVAEVAADSKVQDLFAVVYQDKYAAKRIRFYLAKHDDDTWLYRYSCAVHALTYRDTFGYELRLILTKPPLDMSMRLDDPRCLGKNFVYNDTDVHVAVVLPYKSRLRRWYERLRGHHCAS